MALPGAQQVPCLFYMMDGDGGDDEGHFFAQNRLKIFLGSLHNVKCLQKKFQLAGTPLNGIVFTFTREAKFSNFRFTV